jgi:peptidoglycan/LPS O-acetylase OafA/YrhL
VIFFFGLSGYLVGTSVLKSNQNKTWSWANYFISRLTRLYVVLIPAMLLTLCFDAIGRWNHISAPTYFAIDPESGFSLASQATARSFWGTLLFVQNIYTNVFGTIGPAWSLANEFWYYTLFPLLIACFFRRRLAVFYGLLFIATAIFSHVAILVLFPTWLAGVFAGAIAKRFPLRSFVERRGLFAVSAAAAIGSVLGSAAHRLDMLVGDYILALAAVGFIWSALCSPPSKGVYARVALFLSEISYTLYLTHEPMLVLLSAFWLRGRRWYPDFAHLLFSLIPIGAAILFSYLAYLLFESRTETVRRYLKNNALDRFARLPQPIRLARISND